MARYVTPDPSLSGKCGTRAGYSAHARRSEAACDECTQENRSYNREYSRARSAGRSHGNLDRLPGESAKSAANRRMQEKYSSRTESECDYDFGRLRGAVKKCAGCLTQMPANSFYRNANFPDGRTKRCRNCFNLHDALKRTKRLEGHWVSVGVNPLSCAYCEIAIASSEREVEHFVPTALGGSDMLDNLLPSCVKCNRGVGGKHDREPWEWLCENYPNRVDFIRSVMLD